MTPAASTRARTRTRASRRLFLVLVVGLIASLQVPTAHCFVSRPTLLLQSTCTCSASTTSSTKLFKSRWSQDSDLEGGDKLKACVPYFLPLLDGDHFGRYLFERVPPIGLVHDVLLGGLVQFWEIFPFTGLVFFLALTLGTRGNTEMNRNVRFSAQQAALIDVSLVVPEIIASSFEGEDVPRALLEPCSNFTYYYILSMVAYCVFRNLRGKKPDQIPYISGWSDIMVGPF
jgi:Chloroplast import apparatus Tic20-like